MGKDDFMSPKAIGNRMKAKGLQKLRWFCQMCEKQCRDENGFKCHCASESHQRQMRIFADNPRRFLENFSREFQSCFLKQLSSAHGTKRVFANKVYQELIADRNHLHMNATKWNSLSEFVLHLGREGYVHVDETEKGWFITWIDNSPAALARKAAIEKKERQDVSDEERVRRLLEEQVERAKTKAEETTPQFTELKRENEDEPIKLSLNVKKPILVGNSKLGNLFKKSSLSKDITKSKPFSTLFKESSFKSSAESSKLHTSGQTAKKPLSQLEAIMLEEKSKKRRF